MFGLDQAAHIAGWPDPIATRRSLPETHFEGGTERQTRAAAMTVRESAFSAGERSPRQPAVWGLSRIRTGHADTHAPQSTPPRGSAPRRICTVPDRARRAWGGYGLTGRA